MYIYFIVYFFQKMVKISFTYFQMHFSRDFLLSPMQTLVNIFFWIFQTQSYSHHIIVPVYGRSYNIPTTWLCQKQTKKKKKIFRRKSFTPILYRECFKCESMWKVKFVYVAMVIKNNKKTAIRTSSHRRCSRKKMFLKMSQNLQGNTCARVYFLIE